MWQQDTFKGVLVVLGYGKGIRGISLKAIADLAEW